MGFSFRRRIKIGNSTYLNISKSGVSVSQKVGPVTVNSSGQISANFGNGVSYRTSMKPKRPYKK